MADSARVKQHRNLTLWQPGKSGNPKGRPLGSKHKLSEAFLADRVTAWRKNGRKALGRLATENPAAYLRLMYDICSPVWEAEDGQVAESPRPAFDAAAFLEKVRASTPDTRASANHTPNSNPE